MASKDRKQESSSKSVRFYVPSINAGAAIDSKFVVDIVNLAEQRNRVEILIAGSNRTPPNLAPPLHGEDTFLWSGFRDCLQPIDVTMEDGTAPTADKPDAFDNLDHQPNYEGVIDRRSPSLEAGQKTYHVKIRLTETDDIVLFENPSHIVSQDAEEAALVEEQNRLFETRPKAQRTADAEAQTRDLPCKSRSVNTECIHRQDVASFVSNYDMYDTYNDLERHTKEINVAESASKMEITTYSREGMEDIDERLNRNQNFHLSSMILQRLLAGNVYREQQIRFRNMYPPDPCRPDIQYLYRLDVLWTYRTVETLGKAVAGASWCPANGDIVAIAYGIYGHTGSEDRGNGYVYVWNIKNPVNPERRYRFDCPVTCVAFSHRTPQLLAVGLYDGRVQIRDITDATQSPLAVSNRDKFPIYQPVWDLKWVEFDNENKDEVIAVSQNGWVMKYTLTIGEFLAPYPLLRLDRVEGTVEGKLHGADGSGEPVKLQSDLHPQALCVTIHPVKKDKYYIGTDEGAVHWCSINDSFQHLGVWQMHNRGIFCIEFSPWSPKIFLTCSGDWSIRIWIEDLPEPIVTLSTGFAPIQAAYWSPTNSTVIASVTRSGVQLWDIKRRSSKPASETALGGLTTPLTVARFTNCGRSLLVGDAEGKAHICALEDMPFPPHFQYRDLQSAIYGKLVTKPDLLTRVRRMGYLGY
ncbi:dynein axonemal intermediate chain 4 [Anopheles ziemanni]|uniref:dynein axonemal intermediate chain 4 n=1 Tax=Anopheles coustani TaxID=139045 RepID=UPI002657EA59|nr:dynein axonemal intermediate chain 4 [Anopheles coustani]XP_058177955.1 dynein axonemal intermediate chain 4 [Anopheles ziemanni]